MKSGVRFNWSRRNFLKASVLLGLSTQFIHSCKRKANQLFLKLTGTNHILGHRLRFPDFPNPTEDIRILVLILGGGITGLSAAYMLREKGMEDFLLLEMESAIGGNSRSGENKYSKYPLGAHYLPIPNASNTELYQFLEKCGILIGWTSENKPIFDEEQLSFSPQSRLFISNFWQEGSIPEYGLDQTELSEIEHFLQEMKEFARSKGQDGKFIFDIPNQFASQKHELEQLDSLSMEEWLRNQSYSSPALYHYVNYCCRDDYGTGIKHTSAFAGIHYFASRKHDYFPDSEQVLTWQEGNGRLVEHFRKYTEAKTRNNHICYKIELQSDAVLAYCYDATSNKSIRIIAEQVINCCPQFVNQYLLPERKKLSSACQYAPWIVATIVLKQFPPSVGANLSWDNVLHKANGLGYIYDQHQSLEQFQSPFVLSYYHSLDAADLKKERQKLYDKPVEYWRDFIIQDLSKAHYGIEEYIESIDIHRIGHGMISPVPGYLFGNARKELAKPIDNKLFFAHSDLSGISIFEEAFYQGITAAKSVLEVRKPV